MSVKKWPLEIPSVDAKLPSELLSSISMFIPSIECNDRISSKKTLVDVNRISLSLSTWSLQLEDSSFLVRAMVSFQFQANAATFVSHSQAKFISNFDSFHFRNSIVNSTP